MSGEPGCGFTNSTRANRLMAERNCSHCAAASLFEEEWTLPSIQGLMT